MVTRREFKKLILASCFLSSFSVIAASCSNSDNKAKSTRDSTAVVEAKTVRLAQNLSPISGVAIVAKQQGFFDQHGLNVEVSNFTSGKQCLETVMGGGADIATTAEAPTTAAAMAKQPIAFLARMEYSDLKTLTLKSSDIDTIDDLKGKKIGFTAGTGSEVYTMSVLQKAGLSADDVELVNLRPQEMIPALASASIDAYNTWEPHVSNGKKSMGDKVVQIDTSGIYSETFNIVTTVDYLKQDPEIAENFLRALIDAEQWMKENSTDAIAVVAQAVEMKEDELAAVWDDYIYEVVLDQKTLDILNTHAAWRLDSGNHPPNAEMPDFTTIIYSEPLKTVAPDRVKI
ncbi:MAG TPA: NrtA/SsuA/CpmA family ABC transporter substrate-binding protein [Nodosilinea sp.]|nr:NrtA/SsuA/CpmA family ABC transporter substrate-binding protein [Nodosilinea sp.]